MSGRQGAKYLRIYRDLEAQIRRGELKPGEALPAQRELSERYDVTVMTLRQALQLLEDDGLIEIQHGRGTFVARPRYAMGLGHLASFLDDLEEQGAEVRTTVVTAGMTKVARSISSRLSLRGPEAFLIRRLREVNGRAVVLQSSYLPPEAAARIDVSALSDRPLYALLGEAGLEVGRATETISPVMIEAHEAELLGRTQPSPALLSHRLSYTVRNDAPLIDDHAVLPADSVSIRADRSIDSVRLTYTLTAR